MKLILVRHGQTEGNTRRLYYGSTDIPLSPEGFEGLEKLKADCVYPAAPRFYTSGMLRTEQTLETLYGPVEHDVAPGLREMDFGKFEMHSYDELKEDPEYMAWISGDFESNVTPGGESANGHAQRAVEAFAEIIARGEDAVIVCHGGTIAAGMMEWFSFNNRYECIPKPGEGYIVNFCNNTPENYDSIPLKKH